MVNIKQMMKVGASRKWIERRADDGLIIRDGPSVFRMPGVPQTFLNQAMGAVLSCQGPALVSHRCERAGWRYLEFTWWEMVENPAEVIALVAAALEWQVAA